MYLVTFILYALLFIALSVLLAIFVNAQRCKDRVLCLLTPLFKQAKKDGYKKESYESMHDFLTRLKKSYDHSVMDKIDRLYHMIKYAKEYDDKDVERLKELVRTIRVL